MLNVKRMGKRKRSGSFSKYDDKKSDDGDSQEEMDGESVVVQKGNIINGIRYSARVQEKQEKLRREASPSKQIIIELPSSSSNVPIPCQSSVKPPIIGDESIYEYPYEPNYLSHSVSNCTSGEKKKKRTWELWSQEDKQLFFEALNEFGKDFDAIQSHLASKIKPRSKSLSQSVPKNKDQVRHFYYRTWNKISKYLTFPKDMKKAYQELYGLINYGELRKKQRVLNLKTAVKLSELVEKGTTTIKVRGKTFRIKTPVCRALKKLNQLEDTDHIRVPCKLCVEIIPHDGNTWSSVQRVSHNPRVKVFVPLQRTLASLICYFEERWKTDHNRLKEEFSLTIFGKPRTRLRFIPVESRDLSVPVFKFSEITSATKISLTSYVQNCLYQECKEDSLLVSKKFKGKAKLDSDADPGCRDPDYIAADADVSDADGCETDNQFRITLRRDRFPNEDGRPDFYPDQDNSNGLPDNVMWSVHEENANAAAETDVGETDYGFDENIPSPTDCDVDSCDEDDDGMKDLYTHDSESRDDKQCAACKSPDGEEGNEKVEKQCTCGGKRNDAIINYPSVDAETLAKGWTADEANALTLGEIYLMVGKCDRLCFEYMWDKGEEDAAREDRTRNLVNRLISVARQMKKKKTNRAKTTVSIVTSSANKSPSLACTKCNLKTDYSILNVDTTAPVPVTTASKEDGDSPSVETPPGSAFTIPQQGEMVEEAKSTTQTVEPVERDPCTEPLKLDTSSIDVIAESSISSNDVETETTILENDLGKAVLEEENTSTGLMLSDSIIITASAADTTTVNTPTMVPIVSIPSTISSQPGLIDITTLATNSSNCTEINSNFIRAASNITATILPSPIIHSVQLGNSGIHDVHNTTLCSSPVTATTTVLVSEPAIFAGLEPPSFVAIQPCSATTISTAPSTTTTKPQETKFRRPILMKPPIEDPSTSEDNKMNVPKPFLDLPKGNRRIGRRPAWKQRVIIPRILPLLPKPDESALNPANMTTIITIPPVVHTGLSVLPLSGESFASGQALPVVSRDGAGGETSLSMTATMISRDTTVLIPTVTPTSDKPKSSSIVTSGMTTPKKASSTLKFPPDNLFEKTSSKNPSDESSSSRPHGFVDTLDDNISFSSFMDISIPESTRFMASDLRLEEFECSNGSISLGAILDDSSRKNMRDPPLLDTPKKQQGGDDSQLEIPSPHRQASLDISWPAMTESSDLFMGGLFSGSDTLRPSTNEPLAEGDINFQSVMGQNSLDFESKLSDFSVHITDSNKK